MPAAPKVTPQQMALVQQIEGSEHLRDIARIIHADFKPMYFGAVPYVEAMEVLTSDFEPDEKFGVDDARYIVTYFLANAQTWKGPVARETKSFLKRKFKLK
jgi:hypothetical protein